MKVINFQVPDELHTNAKVKATKQGKSLKDYITDLILIDLESKKEQSR